MKKLNKKGFTLVELLAVIVILAVVMVITIPTVLGSMDKAKNSAFDSAVSAVQKYIDDQTELCKADLGDLSGYEDSLFVDDGSCTLKIDYASDGKMDFSNVVTKAGYSGKMTIILETEEKTITNAGGTTSKITVVKAGNKIKSASGMGTEFSGQVYPKPES